MLKYLYNALSCILWAVNLALISLLCVFVLSRRFSVVSNFVFSTEQKQS